MNRAIALGRGESEIGIATLDLIKMSCSLIQISDTCTFAKTLHKIYSSAPCAIIFPQSATSPLPCKLCLLIQESFDIQFITLARKHYSFGIGSQVINRYCLDDEPLGNYDSKYYATCAVAALFTYAESSQRLSHYETMDGIMLLDVVTAKNLELIRSKDELDGPTLFKVLNFTRTRMGNRLLRMSILQPLCDLQIIMNRLDAVQGISDLKGFPDLDALLRGMNTISQKPSVKNAEQSINQILSLKSVLQKIAAFKDTLSSFESPLIVTIYKVLSHEKLADILTLINDVINDDVVYQKSSIGLRHQRCFAVKSGFNGLLDVARQTYKETTDDVYELVKFYSEKHGLPLKTNFEVSTGFFISLSSQDVAERNLPLEFINVSKKRKNLVFTTLKLMSLNERIHESLTEVYLMSDKAISDVIQGIRSEMSILYKLSECLAMLDMIQSFAHYCSLQKLVRPEFTDTLAIKRGRHPIRSETNDEFVPNDTYASSEANLILCTGPNMSGKSTYMGQICLISIMSQMGMFVPADYVSVRLTDRLFTRMGSDDNLESNASHFMYEMQQMALILGNMTDSSLIIIDELCRGTSASDGLCLSFAICKHLQSTKAFTFFATHFTKLHEKLACFSNIINTCLTVSRESTFGESHLQFLYTIKDGVCKEENYGIQVAKLAGLDSEILLLAMEISQKLEKPGV